MRRVLLTSFEPFGGQKMNSSLEVGRRVAEAILSGVEIDWMVLPVVAPECGERCWEYLEKRGAELVLAMGQAGSSPRIRLEDRAVNFAYFEQPDNAGRRLVGQPVVVQGPAVRRTTVEILRVVETVRSAGHAVEWSFSAGSFVCNHLYYQLLHGAEQRGGGPRVLFVHLPLLPAQVEKAGSGEAMPLERQVDCVREVIRACVE